jgi:hypothetical protein
MDSLNFSIPLRGSAMAGRFMLTGLCCALVAGCGGLDAPPAKPAGLSYAEAITIYNQELELLDRLNRQAATAEAAHEEKLARLNGAAVLEKAFDNLDQLNELAGAANLPALDEESAAKAKELADKARARLANLGDKAKEEAQAIEKEHAAAMAELRQAILEQEAKVAKARQAKDEAEKRR